VSSAEDAVPNAGLLAKARPRAHADRPKSRVYLMHPSPRAGPRVCPPPCPRVVADSVVGPAGPSATGARMPGVPSIISGGAPEDQRRKSAKSLSRVSTLEKRELPQRFQVDVAEVAEAGSQADLDVAARRRAE
jgi:hypothetical protein